MVSLANTRMNWPRGGCPTLAFVTVTPASGFLQLVVLGVGLLVGVRTVIQYDTKQLALVDRVNNLFQQAFRRLAVARYKKNSIGDLRPYDGISEWRGRRGINHYPVEPTIDLSEKARKTGRLKHLEGLIDGRASRQK